MFLSYKPRLELLQLTGSGFRSRNHRGSPLFCKSDIGSCKVLLLNERGAYERRGFAGDVP